MAIDLRMVLDFKKRAEEQAKSDISVSEFIRKAKSINMTEEDINEHILNNMKSLNGEYDIEDGVAIPFEYIPYKIISGITVYHHI